MHEAVFELPDTTRFCPQKYMEYLLEVYLLHLARLAVLRGLVQVTAEAPAFLRWLCQPS